MIYVVAPNLREAQYWARYHSDPPLKPDEWQYIRTIQDLRGLREITLVTYNQSAMPRPRNNYYDVIEMMREYEKQDPKKYRLKQARNNG